MNKIIVAITALVSIAVLAATIQPNKEEPIVEESNACDDLEDCYVITTDDDKEVIGELLYQSPSSVLEVTNLDVQKMQNIVQRYQFDFFGTDLSNYNVNKIMQWDYLLHEFFYEEKLFGAGEYVISDNDKLEKYFNLQRDLAMMNIDEFVSKDVQVITSLSNTHYIVKNEDGTFEYLIYSDTKFKLDDYQFDFSNGKILVNGEDPYYYNTFVKDVINSIDGATMTDSYIQYDFSDYGSNRRIGFISKAGYLTVSIVNYNLVIRFEHMVYHGGYYKRYILSYDEATEHYRLFDPSTRDFVDDSYHDLFQNIFDEQNANSEITSWFYNTFTQDDFTQMLN